MLALTGASMASEQKNDARPQSNETEQTQVARKERERFHGRRRFDEL
jgi:hypothetical protein